MKVEGNLGAKNNDQNPMIYEDSGDCIRGHASEFGAAAIRREHLKGNKLNFYGEFMIQLVNGEMVVEEIKPTHAPHPGPLPNEREI